MIPAATRPMPRKARTSGVEEFGLKKLALPDEGVVDAAAVAVVVDVVELEVSVCKAIVEDKTN